MTRNRQTANSIESVVSLPLKLDEPFSDRCVWQCFRVKAHDVPMYRAI